MGLHLKRPEATNRLRARANAAPLWDDMDFVVPQRSRLFEARCQAILMTSSRAENLQNHVDLVVGSGSSSAGLLGEPALGRRQRSRGYPARSRFQISTIGTWIARLVRTTIENPFKLASPAVLIGPITPAAFELQYPRQIADP